MTRQEQYDLLNQASKMLFDATKLLRKAREGGDNHKLPFFGALQVTHDKCHEGRELLARTMHELRSTYDLESFVYDPATKTTTPK